MARDKDELLAQEIVERWRVLGCKQCLEGMVALALRTARQEGEAAGLEKAAKLSCGDCGRGDTPHHPPYRIRIGPDDWWHENAVRCHAGRIWDALIPEGVRKR